MRLSARVVSAVCALLGACGAPSESAGPEPRSEPPSSEHSQPEQDGPPDPQLNPPPPVALSRPLDQRPVVSAALPPRAISGGTLITAHGGRYAVMSDPDRDWLSVVDLTTFKLAQNVALEPGDEPGRLVEDAAGRVHVALRRAGVVASFSLEPATLLARTPVCPAPRGLTYDGARDELVIACASGELARMPAAGGSARVVAQLGSDLRDVAFGGDQLLATRFHSAELLRVDAETAAVAAARPARARALFGEPSTGALIADTMSAQVAYRLRTNGTSALLLSQLERDGEIDLRPGASVVAPPDSGEPQPTPRVTVSPYGGGGEPSGPVGIGTCGGVVQPLLSLVNADGTIARSRRIPGTLVVDAALANNGAVAVAQAGALDPQRPLADSATQVADRAAAAAVLVFATPFVLTQEGQPGVTPCAPANEVYDVGGQVTAVAFLDDQRVLAQSREPAFLAIVTRGSGGFERVPLDAPSLQDTGHALFHRNAGNGIACASCHAEGGDDGHTWRFSDMGLRRTQSLHVGLAGSAPFHWAGDERDFAALVDDVMVGRMGGARQTPQRIAALELYVYALQAPPAPRAASDEAAQRGKQLFEGAAQCGSCHSGALLSSNETKDVGKGEPLQVPSLVGVAYRKPLMHDGCAPDLRARFEPGCGGGDRHGKTSQLSSAELDDLIAYLETL